MQVKHIMSCTRLTNSCLRLTKSCARLTILCARDSKSWERVNKSCARVTLSCARPKIFHLHVPLGAPYLAHICFHAVVSASVATNMHNESIYCGKVIRFNRSAVKSAFGHRLLEADGSTDACFFYHLRETAGWWGSCASSVVACRRSTSWMIVLYLSISIALLTASE